MHIGNDTDIGKAIPRLRDLGVKWVRLWADVDWEQHTEHYSFQKARELHAAGFRVILELSSHSADQKKARVPTYAEVKSYCDWVQSAPGMKDAIEVWEILNELNLKRYWAGTPQQYVDGVLKAAWDSFHPNGELVLGGAFTLYQDKGHASTRITQQYVDAGYLNYCDFAGSHPYAQRPGDLQKHLDELKAIFGAKPVIMTEWNLKSRKDTAQWAEMLETAKSIVGPHATIICYYRLLGTEREGGWPGVLKADTYEPQEPFYSQFRSWTHPAPSVPVTGVPAPPALSTP